MTFDDYLDTLFGDDLERFLTHPKPPTFLRVNLNLTSRDALAQRLAQRYGVITRPHPATPLALEVVEHPEAHPPGTCLPHFQGHFNVQSLGSMLPPTILDPGPGDRVLDLCAAPGSKASQMAVMLEEQGHLFANELSGRRLSSLAGALDATGLPNWTLVNEPGERLPKRMNLSFDKVLADVPCSGLGRKENLRANRARFEKRGGPTKLPDIQYGLLLSAAKLARVGGRIVYSTCSLTHVENEGVLQMIPGRLPLRILPIPEIEGIAMREGRTRHGHEALHPDTANARRITPWENPTEGFFIALLEKTGELDERFLTKSATSTRMRPTLPSTDPVVAPILSYLEEIYGLPVERLAPFRFLFHEKRRVLSLQSPNALEVWDDAARHGMPLVTFRSGHWRPSHSLVQRFGPWMTRNVVHLDVEQLFTFITTAEVELRPEQRPHTPYPAVSGEGVPPFVEGRFHEPHRLRWKQARRYTWNTEERSWPRM